MADPQDQLVTFVHLQRLDDLQTTSDCDDAVDDIQAVTDGDDAIDDLQTISDVEVLLAP